MFEVLNNEYFIQANGYKYKNKNNVIKFRNKHIVHLMSSNNHEESCCQDSNPGPCYWQFCALAPKPVRRLYLLHNKFIIISIALLCTLCVQQCWCTHSFVHMNVHVQCVIQRTQTKAHIHALTHSLSLSHTHTHAHRLMVLKIGL